MDFILGCYILLDGRIASAVPRVQAGMPHITFDFGYVVRDSLTASQLVKSVTFHKCGKCGRLLYEVKYKMEICVRMVENLLGKDLSVSLDLGKLTLVRGGLALSEKLMF